MKINLQETGKIWFTADWHLGHHNVIKYCNRPFKTTNEMNTTLIKNYNSKVGHHDIVYFLGDFSFLDTKSTKQILSSLNGFKFLIKGNHDRKTNTAYRNLGFMEVYDKPIILEDFVLSHEPIDLQIYPSDLKFINGHLHNNTDCKDKQQFCVSVEKTNYFPISLQEIKNIKGW